VLFLLGSVGVLTVPEKGAGVRGVGHARNAFYGGPGLKISSGEEKNQEPGRNYL